MAGGGVLLAISGLLSLLHGGLCQGGVVEQPLSCFKSSPDCSVNETSLPYSQCCESGTEHFMINDTCYGCAELLRFTSSSFSVEEGAGFVSVQVQRSVNPGTNIFFFSTTINDITANAGIDYGQFPESGIGLINVILEDESLVGSGIVVFDDSVVEYNENFTVGLLALSKDFEQLGIVMDTATVTIIDDDQVDITLQPSEPVVVTEGASFLTYTLNKTGEAVRNVKVDIDLSDPELVYSTAEFTDSHIFEPDEFLYEIMVNVTNDMIVEATEDHMIFLRVPEGETGVNLPQDSVTITVEDDEDFVEIGFQTSIMNVSEESGSFSVDISKTGSNERPVSVRIFTESASAIGGEDFTPIDMIVEFSAGDNLIKFIEVNISSDGIVEDIESFELRLEVPGNESSVILTINTTTISLEDTQFTVMVDEDERFLSVSEGESVSLTVRAAGAAFNRDLIVEVTPRDTMEIVVSPSIVVFNESKSEETVIVTGVDDEFFEGAESVQILITSSDPAVGLLPFPIQVNIEDNDPPQLQFSEAVYMFNETQGTAEIVVTFGAQTERRHSWTLTSVPLTATEFEDYSQIDTTLQFDDNIREHRVIFQIFDDLLSEGLETFRLELRNTEDPNTVTTSSLVEIVDDEKLLVSFFGTSFTAYEGEPLFLLGLNKSGITTSDIRVEINFTDITAIGGVDYGYFPTSEFLAVTLILADETEVLYPILIRDDDIIENVESFNAVLQISDDTGTIILGAIHEAIIYIEDNDKLPVFLTGGGDGVISEEASESERTLEFIVSRDENVTLDRDVVVTLSTADGSARAASGDYDAINVTFTFTATGDLSFSASVFVEDDTTVEATEDFYVSLSGDSAAELPKNATVIYITDNDKIQVNFLDDEYTFNEGDGVATVILTKTGSNEIPVMVSVVTMTQDDTATAGADYNATILPVEFQMTQTQIPLIIPLIDDDILENTESFTVILAVTSGDSNVELGPRNETRITIIDNDDVTVQFLQEDYSGIEGEIISVGVVLSGSSGRIINVGVVSKAGTATEDDFSLPLSIIEFPPGQTSFNLSIELVNDDICDDPGESFTLRLESTDSNVLVGDIGNTTVVINDDDECMIQIINASPVEVQEPEVMTTIELCVELIGMFDRDVRFAAVAEELRDIPVEQQALAGVDFILMPTILTLQPAENIECFDVVIRGDMRTDDKMFSVRILPDEGLRTGRAEVNVTILDQDLVTTDPPIGLPVVEFSTDVYNVLESDGGVIITLIASPPPPNNTIVSVLFSTQDGSATAPDDYVSQTDVSVTIEGGEATISVAIIMDVVAETQETFEVLLSLPEDDEILVERVILGTLTRATVFINDDPGLLLPTNVMAIQDGPTSILVTWTPSSDAIGYMIDYDSIGGDSGSVIVSDGSTDEHTLTNLQNGDIYTVSIVTTSSDGETSESVRAMVVRLVSGPPTVSVLGFTTATSIFISLSVPTDSVVDSYEVMWQRDTTVGCPDVDEGSDSIITTLYDIKGLEENSRYIITVTASNSAGSSEVSNTVTAITDEAVPSAAPTSVSVSEVTSSNITVQWEAVDCIHQNGDITSYSVQYNEVGSEIIRSLTVSQDEVTITGLSSSTTYSIEVAAINSAGTGVFSEVITTQTKLKLSLTCTASGISEVTIDCEGIEDATLQCSFNSGPLYQCSVPMVLTIDVHPPGIYFIRFVSITGDEDTVTYNITDIKTDVSPIVPKLRVNLINGSPRLIAGNTAVEAEFEVSRPVAGVRCYLRSQTARVYKNCSSGVVSFDGLKSGRYILKVHAYNRGGDVATVKRGFVINDN